MHAIVLEFGLALEFPEKVMAQAEKLPDDLTDEEFARRRDMRKVNTFTIDPDDAKDFDDALSVERLPNGNYEVGIHIADVSHYVKTGTLLDKEAYRRATSVYLVDRTIPMLPERLSNQLCSLRPHETKLTFSAVFELEESGKMVAEWFGRTVTYSDRRFTYEEAQEVIESGQGDFAQELTLLNNMALNMRAERYRKGAINFETQEVKFVLDEAGKPVEVIPKTRKDAHKLIEEFMLLANMQVATFIYNKKTRNKQPKTFVYRTHDYPDADRLKDFSMFAGKFGYKLNLRTENISRSLNDLIGQIEGKPEQNVLESLAIRTMAKAKYTTQTDGHFGLGFDHYTHFTSPIRRYPDVMVHRLLQRYLDSRSSADQEEFEAKCTHSSEREKVAAEAERASIKYKQVEFMQDHNNIIFKGIVSGVTEWGVFVEITSNKCEGLVRMASLKDDFYEFDERNYRIIGRRKGRIINLGDDVKVRVFDTDIDKRTIDLDFVWA